MPLFWFLLVLVSLGCGSAPAITDTDPYRSLVASAGVILAWGVLAKVAAYTTLRQVHDDQIHPLIAGRLLQRQLECLRWIGLAAAVLCLLGFGLANTIGAIPAANHWMSLRAVLLLAPALTIVMLTWWADHQFAVAVGQATDGWRSGLLDLLGSFRLQAAWLVAPVLLLLGVIDLTRCLPGVGDWGGGSAGALAAVAALPLALPALVSRLWKTQPLAAIDSGSHLLALPAAVGLKHLRVLRWDTGDRVCNAMVAGFVPRFRALLLSDALLSQMPRQQAAMIVLHELAHLRRWHVPMRMTAIVPAWSLVAASRQWLPAAPLADLLSLAAAILSTLIILRLVAHRTEYDADHTACLSAAALAGRVDGVPLNFAEAARAMSEALGAVTADNPASRRGSWLHPSVQARQQALTRLAASQ